MSDWFLHHHLAEVLDERLPAFKTVPQDIILAAADGDAGHSRLKQRYPKAAFREYDARADYLAAALALRKQGQSLWQKLGSKLVSALSEWVISKNIQPEDNIAADYIRNLQQDANRLDIINQTIKKYNIALQNCLEGSEDVALIQLKKILAQNPKLIKGYHLLALLYIHSGEYEKARKLLKKAIRIDKTNTTTLRFLREVDEQTGTATSLESHFSLLGGRRTAEEIPSAYSEETERTVMQPSVIRGSSARTSILNMLIGVAIGAAAIWALFIPAYTRSVNRAANEKITKYSSDLAIYAAQIQTLTDQVQASEATVEAAKEQMSAATAATTGSDNLIKAVSAVNSGSNDSAANALAAVERDALSAEGQAVYDSVASQVATALAAALKKQGLALFNSKDYEDAVKKLEAAMALDATDYDVMNYLAHAYRMIGDTANADRVLNLIIQTFPDSQKAENAREYLSSPDAEIKDSSGGSGNDGSDEDSGGSDDGSEDGGSDDGDYERNDEDDYDEDGDYDRYDEDDYDEDYDRYDEDEDYD